jgi:Fe-S oxidoreductase/nitrate reductase gamma subunit
VPVSPLAAEKTREVFWGLSTFLEVLWYVLAIASVLVFLYGIAIPPAKYLRGHRAWLPPRAEWRARVTAATRTLLAHSSIRDPYVSWAHLGIFYGFIVLFAGTVILSIDTDFTEPIFGWRFFKGDFYLAYSIVLDVFGLALIAGLALMMVRRGILRPRKLDYARPDRAPGEPQYNRRVYRTGDWVFLGALLYLALTGYVLEGIRIAMDAPGYNAFSPAGWVAAHLFAGLGLAAGTLATIRHVLWWSHGLVAIAFVAAIPYTKAAHMFTSYVSLVLRDPDAGRRLRPIPPGKEDEPAGYATLEDFSVNHLLHLDACTKCGRCHEACPANATGRPLSPRDVILELREQSNAHVQQLGVGGVLGTLLNWGPPTGPPAPGPDSPPVVRDDGVRSETIWACMQCNACVETCPVGIEQAPIINQIRRRLLEDGDVDPTLQSTLQVIHKSGNSFGENKRKRGRWAKELDFPVKDARKEPVDVLWFVGDYASFDPRSQRVTQAIARLLHRAGVDFGILYDGERNAGNDVRRVGEEGLFEALAEENIGTLSGCRFNRIVTSDPHSLNTLRHEYPELGGAWPVVHHTTLLLELIDAGRLDIGERLGYRVTYHDPCYLGRYNGTYDEPRAVIERLGCELVEMPRNRENSFCCGAGGGRIWIPDTPGAERPSESRIHEAVRLGGIDFFVVACPKDVTMYEDAIKTSGHAGDIELRELTELVEEALVRNLAAAPAAQ